MWNKEKGKLAPPVCRKSPSHFSGLISFLTRIVSAFTADKSTIPVVMHHTFNPKNVIANSRDQVTEPNVLLTVDCFFFGRKLLTCNRNELACYEIQKFWGISPSQVKKTGYIDVIAEVTDIVLIIDDPPSFSFRSPPAVIVSMTDLVMQVYC